MVDNPSVTGGFYNGLLFTRMGTHKPRGIKTYPKTEDESLILLLNSQPSFIPVNLLDDSLLT